MALPLPKLIYVGLRTFLLPPPKGTGGTVSARYCYSIYLRHLAMAARNGLPTAPRVVAEIGPGDSLGIGLTSLLLGADKYYAFDVMEHASVERNIAVFDELVELVRARAPIPGDDEFPENKPRLDDYAFPSHVFDEARLEAALAPARIARLRAALAVIRDAEAESPIRYIAPWFDDGVIRPGSVDMIFSQAVMEHVDALEEAYEACFRWLRPGGFMSHQIDFRSHDTADEWNGHWAYSDLTWWAIRGARPWLLNRQPYSAHLRLIKAQGFEIVHDHRVRLIDGIPRHHLAARFRTMSEEDLCTSGAFIQARKPASLTVAQQIQP